MCDESFQAINFTVTDDKKTAAKSNKKYELMLMRCAKAYIKQFLFANFLINLSYIK